MQADASQAAYMKDVPPEKRAPAEKMATEVVNLVFSQSPEMYAGLAFPALKLDAKAGLEGTDKELANKLDIRSEKLLQRYASRVERVARRTHRLPHSHFLSHPKQ